MIFILDMKLDYTISRIFQEMSTLRIRNTTPPMRIRTNTNITITCTSSIKKYPMQDTYYLEIDQIF